MIHQRYGPYSLALARVLVFGGWALFILLDPLAYLAELPRALVIQHGVLQWLPAGCADALFCPAGLVVFKITAIALCLAVAVGPPFPHVGALAACVGVTLYLGIIRAYGGHVHHQELIYLYAAYLLAISPCWERWSLYRNPKLACFTGSYALPLLGIGLVLLMSYYAIGVARLVNGGIEVFGLETMQKHIYHHAFKTNYWTFDWALAWIQAPLFQQFLRLGFIAATILEVVAPLAFFHRRFLYAFCVAAIGMHISIWLLMNIFFIQNILLLAFFLVHDWLISRIPQPSAVRMDSNR